MSTSSTTELYHNVPSAVVDVGASPDIDDAAKLTTAQLVTLLDATPRVENSESVSVILISPPSLCEIVILLFASTEAIIFVAPALLIASAITSASVAAPVATADIALATPVALPATVSVSVNAYDCAVNCVATASVVNDDSPDALLLYILKSPNGAAASLQLD